MTSEKPLLVYLAAASHSGSTLTAMLLSAHPDVSCVGELKGIKAAGNQSDRSETDMNAYLCSCREKIATCDFWLSISASMKKRGFDFTITDAGTDIRAGASAYELRLLNPLVRNRYWEFLRDVALSLSPGWLRNKAKIQDKNTALIKSVLEKNGNNVIVDSSKIGIRLKYLLQNTDVRVKVVWVVRNGKGVSLAYLNPSAYADAKNPEMKGGGTGETMELGRDVKEGALEWRKCNQETLNVLERMDTDCWMKVHYEDLCTDTEATLQRVFEFIEVAPDGLNLDYRSVNHHMIGNGMRLDSSSEIALDERWRDDLSVEQLQQFQEVAGDLNEQLGYSK